MNQQRSVRATSPGRLTYLALAVTLVSPVLCAAEEGGAFDSFKVDGYLREEVSVNTKNWADTPNYNDRGKVSMARTTLRLNADWKATDTLSIVAKWRGSQELKTPFLKHLEQMGASNYTSGGAGTQADIMDLYNKSDFRELYVDWQATDRVKFRFGRQQIVWGETDFFNANDMVHGFNLTWRSFLEPANEELRKPLIILKTNIDLPEANGAIEAFVRPGWDRKKDIGTELDIYGGRWSSQPYAGVDFRNIDPYNLDNKEGDYKKVTGGIRWNGTTDHFNYSLSYLKTFWQNPILNPSSTDFAGGAFYVPTTQGASNIKPQQGAIFGEIIYPLVDVFGATASGYADWADAVFSTEVAYIKDAPYQFNNFPNNSLASTVVAPGFDGFKKKNVIAWMLRMDKNIAATQSLLGSEKPMFFSVQLFDKWIQDFNENEGLLNSVGWGARTKEHSFLLTGIFSLSYNNGRIKPELVVGTDLTYKGGFFAPSVTMELSKSLKWKIEYDGFWDGGRWRDTGPGSRCASPGANQSNCDSAGLFGYFHNRDQLYTSLTYQF
uniref:Probable regulatory protein, LysR n=1 Tax=Dechloromonas aromatica (strain RCB) TaxID=159087 RepID=Q47GD1_DECAR